MTDHLCSPSPCPAQAHEGHLSDGRVQHHDLSGTPATRKEMPAALRDVTQLVLALSLASQANEEQLLSDPVQDKDLRGIARAEIGPAAKFCAAHPLERAVLLSAKSTK